MIYRSRDRAGFLSEQSGVIPAHIIPRLASDASVQRSVTVSPRTHALYRCPPKSAWTVPGALV